MQPRADSPLSISEVLANKQENALSTADNFYVKVAFNSEAAALSFNNPAKERVFYQLSQAGFSKNLPRDKVQNGMEVYRIKATNIGTYTIPPISVSSMYDPSIKAQGLAGKMVVTKVE